MKKRGLSTVVTTVIMVLLVLVAIGIVWGVIKNLVTEKTDEISNLNSFMVDLKITAVSVDGNNLNVKVKRDIGEGDLYGLNFVVSDGTNSETFKLENIDLKELEEKTFSVNYLGVPKEITVAPLSNRNGDVVIGGSGTTKTFSEPEAFQTLGVVSWWSFDEENAKDELSSTTGILENGVDCSVEGKSGKACSFDGIDDYINISNFQGTDEFTISAWSYIGEYNSNNPNTIIHTGGTNNDGVFLYIFPDISSPHQNELVFGIGNSTDYISTYSGTYITLNQWQNYIGTCNASELKLYINGVEISSQTNSGIINWASAKNIGINTGLTTPFKGTIDEVMIFDKALTAEQISKLSTYEFE